MAKAKPMKSGFKKGNNNTLDKGTRTKPIDKKKGV